MRPAHCPLRPDADPRLDQSMYVRYDPPAARKTGASCDSPGASVESARAAGRGIGRPTWRQYELPGPRPSAIPWTAAIRGGAAIPVDVATAHAIDRMGRGDPIGCNDRTGCGDPTGSGDPMCCGDVDAPRRPNDLRRFRGLRRGHGLGDPIGSGGPFGSGDAMGCGHTLGCGWPMGCGDP